MYVDGLVLRTEAYKAGLRMGDVARMAGIAATTLSNIANGKRCRAETAQKIADALGIPLNKLSGHEKRR